MTARDRILTRLRVSQPQDQVSLPPLDAHDASPARDASPATRLARLCARLASDRAEVHLTDQATWPSRLARLCREKGVTSLLYGSDTEAGSRLDQKAFSDTILRPWTGPIEDLKGDLFHRVDAGLTRARGAIADTGTLIIWPSAAEPRSLSLVPPIHFVLLDAAAIQPSLFDALRSEQWAAGLPTNVLLISGPSKTADIQQTLAYGAHGPRELIVLVIDGEGASP